VSTLLILFQQGGGGFLESLIILAVISIVIIGLVNRFKKHKGGLMRDDEADWRGWRSKTDDQIVDAVRHLGDYTEKAQRIIREESNFRGLADSPPTKRPIDESRSPIVNSVSSLMSNRKRLGIIIAIIGVALIIISPSLLSVKRVPGDLIVRGDGLGGREQITDLRDVAKFGGVALLIVGGIIAAVGFSQSTSTQPTSPPTPTTQPFVTQSVSPRSVELGNTPDEVQSVMGQPDKIINLGARVIHVYKDMKIIYVDGKVSDVQLS
jgi:hypothetical protein